MLPRSCRAGFGKLDLLLIVARVLVLGFMMIPSLTMRVASRRDAQRLEDMQRIEAAIMRYWVDHGSWPPAEENQAYDGWDVSNDGDFIPALQSGGYLQGKPGDPRNDDQYQYRYRVFPKGSLGLSSDGPTYVLGVRSFETVSARRTSLGGFQCPDRDFTREFAWVTGNSAPTR